MLPVFTTIDYHGPGRLVVCRVGCTGEDRRVHLLAGPGDQKDVGLLEYRLGDGGGLIGRLTLAEHHLGKAGSYGPMVIYLGKAQILVREVP